MKIQFNGLPSNASLEMFKPKESDVLYFFTTYPSWGDGRYNVAFKVNPIPSENIVTAERITDYATFSKVTKYSKRNLGTTIIENTGKTNNSHEVCIDAYLN